MRRRSGRQGRAGRQRHVHVVIRTLAVLVAVLGVVLLPEPVTAAPSAGTPAAAAGPPVRSCASLTSVALPDELPVATIVSAGEHVLEDGTRYCDVEVRVTNAPADDVIRIEIWLPVATWNGRFQGTGGGGFSGGSFAQALTPAIQQGYAAGSTDTGHEGDSTDGTFALNPDGTLNEQRIVDYAYLGIHQMTVAGQALTEAYYGNPAAYSYFNGCSTGGRQGLMEAQRYPDDYDGIASGAPAINFTQLHPAQLWSHVVMLERDHVVPQCGFDLANRAAVAACDPLDGVTDGIIGDWQGCDFDARALIGTETGCGTFTAADAAVVNAVWDGPRTRGGERLWFGLTHGTTTVGLTNPTVVDGTLTTQPNPITLGWFRYFVQQDPDWDWRTLTHESYERLFAKSEAKFEEVIGTRDVDLREFRDHGGKAVIWHGLADQLIYPQGTVDYYERLQDEMGAGDVGEFARMFLAPGVEHCDGGPGAAPVDPLAVVVDWVENGTAPDVLPAANVTADGAVTMTRPLCAYPQVARYDGAGDPNVASSFDCADDFGKPAHRG